MALRRRGRWRQLCSEQTDGAVKRSNEQGNNDEEFPAEDFIHKFCREHDLLPQDASALSDAQKECEKLSELARQGFKCLLDISEDREDVKSLNVDKKYERRLRRNRRSAACAKVAKAILKRAQITKLHEMSSGVNTSLKHKVRCLELERDALLKTTASLREKLINQEASNEALESVCTCKLSSQDAQREHDLVTSNNLLPSEAEIQSIQDSCLRTLSPSTALDEVSAGLQTGLDEHLLSDSVGEKVLLERTGQQEDSYTGEGHEQQEDRLTPQNFGDFPIANESEDAEKKTTLQETEPSEYGKIQTARIYASSSASPGASSRVTTSVPVPLLNENVLTTAQSDILDKAMIVKGYPPSQESPLALASDPSSPSPPRQSFESFRSDDQNSILSPRSLSQDLYCERQDQDLTEQCIGPSQETVAAASVPQTV